MDCLARFVDDDDHVAIELVSKLSRAVVVVGGFHRLPFPFRSLAGFCRELKLLIREDFDSSAVQDVFSKHDHMGRRILDRKSCVSIENRDFRRQDLRAVVVIGSVFGVALTGSELNFQGRNVVLRFLFLPLLDVVLIFGTEERLIDRVGLSVLRLNDELFLHHPKDFCLKSFTFRACEGVIVILCGKTTQRYGPTRQRGYKRFHNLASREDKPHVVDYKERKDLQPSPSQTMNVKLSI